MYSIQKLIDLKWRQRKEQIEKLKTKLNTLDQVEIWQEILQKSFEVKVILLCHFCQKKFQKNFQNNFQKSILLFHLKDLLQELQLGSLKVLDVLHAYQWKALESNEKLNNIVWVRNIINFISQIAHFIATYFYRFSHKYYYKVLLYTAGLNSLARYIPIYF